MMIQLRQEGVPAVGKGAAELPLPPDVSQPPLPLHRPAHPAPPQPTRPVPPAKADDAVD